jgi:hypothetical protein
MIRIGILNYNTPRKIEMQKYRSDGRMIITPLRVDGLSIKQQSFRHCVEQFKWNCITKDDVDKDYEDEDNDKANGDGSNVDN